MRSFVRLAPMALSLRATAVLKWMGISLGVLVLLVPLTALVLERNANAFKGIIGRIASADAGRTIHLDGRLELHLLSLEPRAVLESVGIGNPAWSKSQDMARIGRLEVSLALPALFKGEVVLPRVGVEDLELSLERDAADRANWRFTTTDNRPQASKPAHLPVVRSLSLNRAHIEVLDAVRKLHFIGTLAATQAEGDQSLRLDGTGQMNGESFSLVTQGDPLVTAERGRPYAFAADIHAGRTRLQFQARIAKPFDLGTLAAKFSASGADLADVYYLTGLTLPNTPAYTLSGNLQRDGTLIHLTELAGTLGNSDLHGSMQIETAGARPLMTADLGSRSLDIDDLGPTFGGAPRGSDAAPASTRPTKKQLVDTATPLLLPNAPLDLERVRGMDADVRYRAASVDAQKIPFKEVAWRIRLDHGVMTIDPLSFVLPAGRIAGRLRIDARADVPEVTLDGRLTAVELSQFHSHNGEAPLDGVLLGRLSVHGRGRSVHAVAATANGTLTAVIPHGQVRAAFAELTGINVARGLGLLLVKNQQKAAVRCAVADFKSSDGIMTAQNIVMDTQNVMITGKGTIDLRTETLDLSMNGQPKKLRFGTIKSPVLVHGTLSKPRFALDTAHLAKQSAIAAVLAALTPLAAVIAFVDPGLAKDADCGTLLADAQKSGVPMSARTVPLQAPPARP
jgi:AsmA family protein